MLTIVVAAAALAAPAAAAAHPSAPAAALDFRLRLFEPMRGVRADVIDGDRSLRLRVDPSVQLVVRGLLGEPVLRFAPDGVWVNGRSPTAAADKLLPSGRRGEAWIRLTRGHSLTWHDHRLAPPPSLPTGASAPFSLPVTVDGRPGAIRGTFTHAPRPPLWPWLLGAALGLGALAALVRVLPARRDRVAAALAGAAAAAALAGDAGFATGDPIARTVEWVEVGSAGLLALVAAGALLIRERSTRIWVATLIGALAAALSLGSLGVFWHGVVISSLPAPAARLAIGVAVVGGCAAAVLGVLTDGEPARARAKAVRA
jgi:hypothetical protein